MRRSTTHWLRPVPVSYEDWAVILQDCQERKIDQMDWVKEAVQAHLQSRGSLTMIRAQRKARQA